MSADSPAIVIVYVSNQAEWEPQVVDITSYKVVGKKFFIAKIDKKFQDMIRNNHSFEITEKDKEKIIQLLSMKD